MAAALQAVTHRLPWFVKDPAVNIIGEVSARTIAHIVPPYSIASDTTAASANNGEQARTLHLVVAHVVSLELSILHCRPTCAFHARRLTLLLTPQKCYRSLIHDIDLSDKECIQYSMSKLLGLAIVMGGAVVKVPQIIKIVNGRSARGLSLASFLLDSAGTGINVAYNIRKHFPWSTYGESVFLLVQNVRDGQPDLREFS